MIRIRNPTWSTAHAEEASLRPSLALSLSLKAKNLIPFLSPSFFPTIMDSNQRSIIMPLIQDTEYPVEKRQQDLVFHQLRPTKKRTLVGRIIFTLSAIVIGSFVLAKLFGVSGNSSEDIEVLNV